MRFCVAVASVFALVSSAGAIPLPITLADPYMTNSGNDVIGSLADFDLDYVRFATISASEIRVVLRFNYDGGRADLPAFNNLGVGPLLEPADLLFGDLTNSYKWGVPLKNHDALTAGNLYTVMNPAQPFVRTAKDVLGDPAGVEYRKFEAVWINRANVDLAAFSPGSVLSSTRIGMTPEIELILRFTPTESFLKQLAKGMSVHFASATCANDILDGRVQFAVPEPSTLALCGGGLLAVAIALGRRLRRR